MARYWEFDREDDVEKRGAFRDYKPRAHSMGSSVVTNGGSVGPFLRNFYRHQVAVSAPVQRFFLFLILAGYEPVTGLLSRFASARVVDVVAAFSVMTHFDAFQRGVIDLRDVLFFASVMGFALFTTGVIIRSHRAG